MDQYVLGDISLEESGFIKRQHVYQEKAGLRNFNQSLRDSGGKIQ